MEKESGQEYKTILWVALILLAFILVLFFMTGEESQDKPEISDWETYRNEEYKFEVKHPADWSVRESTGEHDFSPKFNIYKESENHVFPLTHHSPGTHFSIFPKGIPTEGVFGRRVDAETLPEASTQQSSDYILENGEVWGTYINFENPPEPWEPFGFLWASVKIENLETECLRNGEKIEMEKCDLLFGDEILRSGDISEGDREIEEGMIKSFKFLGE